MPPLCQFPSASFKLSLSLSFTPTQLSCVPASFPTSLLLSLPVAFFCPLPPSTHTYKNLTLVLPLSQFMLSLFFLTSSSVVWLTEKCLICRAVLLDSSWSKMSAKPPGANGTWYSTTAECWSCVLEKDAKCEVKS